MKYLEHFGSNFDHYTEISFEDFRDAKLGHIPSKYKTLLKNIYDHKLGHSLITYTNWGNILENDYDAYLVILHKYVYINRKGDCSYTIKCGLDEYWYVDLDNSLKYIKGPSHSYYKCDQWDGLVSFLKKQGFEI